MCQTVVHRSPSGAVYSYLLICWSWQRAAGGGAKSCASDFTYYDWAMQKGAEPTNTLLQSRSTVTHTHTQSYKHIVIHNYRTNTCSVCVCVSYRGRSPDWYNKVFGHLCAVEVARIRGSFPVLTASGSETKLWAWGSEWTRTGRGQGSQWKDFIWSETRSEQIWSPKLGPNHTTH